MKKLLTLSAAILILIGAHFSLDAHAVTCSTAFPTSTDSYVAGNCIPSATINNIEAKIGANNSTTTTSLDYLLNNLFTSYQSAIIKATSTQGLAQIANNLSDLANVVTARNNLGLGSAALRPSTDFLASSTLGTGTNNNCAKYNGTNALADAGAPCGSGSGGSSTSSPGNFTVNGTATSTITGDFTSSNIQNLNNVLYFPSNFQTNGCAGSSTATTFQGCMNALYQSQFGIASGTTIVITKSIPIGSWNATLNLNNNFLVPSIKCTAGVWLNYTGSGYGVIFNFGDPTGHVQSDDSGCWYSGGKPIIAGQANNATTTGIKFGGAAGAVNINFHDNSVGNFGTNIENSSNSYMMTFNNNAIYGWNGSTGAGIIVDQGSNSGEGMRYYNNTFTDPGNSTTTGAAIKFSDNSVSDALVSGGSIDDARIYQGLAINLTVEKVHFENSAPAIYPGYNYIYSALSSASSLNLLSNTFDNDSSAAFGQPPAFVEEAVGDLTAIGNYFDLFGSQGPVSIAIDHSIGASVPNEIFCGNHNQNTAFTNLANNIPNGIGSAGCWYESANSFPAGLFANGSNVNSFYSGSTVAGTYNNSGNWTMAGTLSAGNTSITGSASTTANLTVGGTVTVAQTSTFNGNVNIGVANQKNVFDIAGNRGAFSGLMSIQNTVSTGYSAMDMYDSNGVKVAGFGAGSPGSGAPYAGNFYLGTNFSTSSIVFLPNALEAARFTGAGLFGIGTTQPSSTVHVAGTSSTVRIGTGGVNPGCIELYDAVNSSTINYVYSSSTALVVTATKPSFCR